VPAGAGAGAAVGGGMLWNLVRSMLGGALGFNGKGGVMSWLFRTVFLRYGWSILKTILTKVLLRR
jgi:predicted membrane protein